MINRYGWRTEAHIRSYKIEDGVTRLDRHIVVPNLITTVGDRWANDRIVAAAGGTPSNAYNAPQGMLIGNSGTAPAKSQDWILGDTNQAAAYQDFTSVTDDESNNRITWSASWSATQCTDAAVQEVCIVPGDTESTLDKAIVRLVFTPVDKSGSDTPLNITIHWVSNNTPTP